MNNLKFLNKLRKKHLDRERKKQLNKFFKEVNQCYVEGKLLTYKVDFEDRSYLDFYSSISQETFDEIEKYLDKLGIKYTKITTPIFEEKTPYNATIRFIYEEDLNE